MVQIVASLTTSLLNLLARLPGLASSPPDLLGEEVAATRERLNNSRDRGVVGGRGGVGGGGRGSGAPRTHSSPNIRGLGQGQEGVAERR